FYERIIDKTKGLETPFQKQGLIKDLYNKFFQKIDSNLSAKLGIVYTPIEIVDFMIHSVDDLLYKEFGKRLTDEKVRVIDPFTGTGSYVVRLLQSGLIQPKDLERKYTKEIQAREINLLAYYTADVNIESAYYERSKELKDYDNIILTDTFQVEETDLAKQDLTIEKLSKSQLSDNFKRIQLQRNSLLEVIIGNPPYSISKTSFHPGLKKKSKETYGRFYESRMFIRNSYIKAFRWATDKLKEGVIAYITPSSWLIDNGGRGIRHHFEQEFHAVYVYDLKGERRPSTHGFNGNSVFEIKSDVAITFLIKNPKRQAKANIYYAAIDEKIKKKEKLDIIKNTQSVINLDFKKITPNAYDDWVDKREEFPGDWIQVYKQKRDVGEQYFFITDSSGLQTGNDPKQVNFSLDYLLKNYRKEDVRPYCYRPFTKNYTHFGKDNYLKGAMEKFFPKKGFENKVICISPMHLSGSFSILVSDNITDISIWGGGEEM
ncbi:MAG: N-6 DNA methylase, partial [Flavobacteriaceae bacterium]|nr:N-6 DNA methylase [Flavobacteriaceae bacterium]